jgi:predicted nicotinamide N-methyase
VSEARPPELDLLVELGPFTLALRRPTDSESLIDESRFDENEFLPYWAEPWPSGIALASHVAALDLAGLTVLELGCGLAMPSFAAALVGARVHATDWSPESIDLVARNAAANGLEVTASVLRWDSPEIAEIGCFDLVLAADVLYEERNAMPVLGALATTVGPAGEALLADPGRRHATAFFDGTRAAGWLIDEILVDGLPSGGISRLSRR